MEKGVKYCTVEECRLYELLKAMDLIAKEYANVSDFFEWDRKMCARMDRGCSYVEFATSPEAFAELERLFINMMRDTFSCEVKRKTFDTTDKRKRYELVKAMDLILRKYANADEIVDWNGLFCKNKEVSFMTCATETDAFENAEYEFISTIRDLF